ncbi:MAG: hypothetical protein FADNKDHG_00284 [Holosporales bacterium]
MHYLYIFLCLIIYGLNASQSPESDISDIQDELDQFVQETSRFGEGLDELMRRPITAEEAYQRKIKFGTPQDLKQTLSTLIPEFSVKMPKEYKPFIDVLKELFPRTEGKIDFTASYADVRQRLLSIKNAFIDVMESDITLEYLKSFEISKGFYDSCRSVLLEKNIDIFRIMPTICNFPKMLIVYRHLLHHPCDDSYRYMISDILISLDNFFPRDSYRSVSYKWARPFDIGFMISQPKEVIDQYFPLSFQKIIFPFNLIDLFLTCFDVFDETYRTVVYTPEDIRNFFIEDRPFMDQFELFLNGNQIGVHPGRYIENMYFMTDDPSLFTE